ncbi:S-layer homology domain-containing protein [Paenibacillus sp. GD4]|uniref:S-layer homology domain-containing protein n=1 Tax=Paenibacillus sp. GD4 TaxID=3068890 RepID=UPI002796860A|nr:S-layer homology domain-containing protein [Paenibacillus sp. GD4]MDQ1914368.1 S-layer homology domain-containing protein [Paenibacillus sp. GD4]
MSTMKRWLTMLLLVVILTAPLSVAKAATEPMTLSSPMATAAPATIFPYSQPAKYEASVNYRVKANGVEIPVVKAYSDYDYTHFSMSEGPVTYEVTILNTNKVHEYTISPKKLGIKADKVEGTTLTFTTQKDEYLIVSMNSRTTRLVIAADPQETDVPAASGTGIYNISQTPYQVAGNGDKTGVAARTAAIQQAIDDASSYGTAQGGGVQGIVYVPAGEYYISNLVLKSNTALYMQPGAAFIGTGKTADYTEHWFKDSMGRPATWWISTEFGSANIKIYGRGTIDGNGKALHDDKTTNNRGMINNLIVPIATSNFVMDGVTIRESAAWAVMPVRSNNLKFTNLKMFNSLGMGENDGIDIVESQDVVVRNSIGIALDDPYSTKAWKEDTDIASGKVPWPGSPEPVRNVLFEDAIAWTLCYGFKIGQGVMQDQDNITFRDGVVYKAAVGFAVHHKYGTGEVRNVTFENMDVEDISGKNEDNSAWMTMFTVNNGGNGVGPITGVTVKNITVRDAGESIIKMKGMEGALITGVTFENVYMPGKSVPATNLYEMNFMDRAYHGPVTIKPVQNPEPRPRTNLALRQPAVISSNDNAQDSAPFAFDGSFTTRSGTKRGVDPGWIYVDLGESKRINEVHLYWEAAYGKSYEIQVSDDAQSWSKVYGTTGGKGALEKITFSEVDARYVRMYGTVRATQYGYSIWEFEVYGPEVLADEITLDHSQLKLLAGTSGQLTATLLPANTTHKRVTWTTSNAGVATVNSSGLVTAIGAGTATITATTQNGELSAKSEVTVTGIGTPQLKAPIAGDGEISLSWDTVPGATEYKIFRRMEGASYAEPLATVNAPAASYLAEGLTNGTTYYFVVKAVYASGESEASREVSAAPKQWTAIAHTDAHIQYIGRWDRSTAGASSSYWPGAMLRVSFTGTNVSVKLGAAANLYAKLDNGPYVPYTNVNGTVRLTPVPLTEGTHTLTLASKDIQDVLVFEGLLLDSGATTTRTTPRSKLIEFIGDSITVGYTTPEVSLSSYAWLAGEQLGADHTQIAYTGICLQTGVSCYAPNSLGMSEQYFKLQTGDYPASPSWDFHTYRPDAIVINLGTNDAKFNVTDNDFESTYTTFLQQIRVKYPHAHVFVLRTLGGFKAAPTLAAVNSRIAAGDDRVHYVDTTGWVATYPSADFHDSLHPSKAGHVKIANRLVEVLSPYLQATAPQPPELHPAIAGDGAVTLSWEPVNGAAGYRIYSSLTSGSYGTAIATVGEAVYSYRAEALTNGNRYYFVVRALGDGGESVPSNEVSATPLVPSPGAPLLKSAVPGNGHVQLGWEPVAGSLAYQVFLSTGSGAYGTAAATVGGSVYSYEAAGLANGTTYYFVVKAVGPGGLSEASNEVSATPKTVPGAPTAVTAAASNGQAIISFSVPVSDGGSPIQSYKVVSSPGMITATGTNSPITVTGLMNGTSYTFTVTALNHEGSSAPSAPSNAVIPIAPPMVSEDDDTSEGGRNEMPMTSAPPAPIPSGNGEPRVLESTATVNGQSVTTVTLNHRKLEEQLEAGGMGVAINIPVSTKSDVVIGEFNGDQLRLLEQKQAVLELVSEQAAYALPVQQLPLQALLEQFGSGTKLDDVKVQIEIAKPSAGMVKLVKDAAAGGGFTLVAEPLHFTVKGVRGEKTVEISRFGTYVERTIAIPEGIGAGRIATGVVVEADGSVRHVPTRLVMNDGKYYAQMSSLTNSTYAVISHQITFDDMEGHWAKSKVQDMAARMVIQGTGQAQFQPDRSITRGEFAAILIRALGLKPERGAADRFPDVSETDWYSGAVHTAYAYKLISGYEDGTFRAEEVIRREQAMSMLTKAMSITGLAASLEHSNGVALLNRFADREEVSAWAVNAMADCLQAGLIDGRDGNLLDPGAPISRAEAAVILQRLLHKSGLID